MLLHYPIMEENGINRKNTVLLNRGMGIPFKSSSSKNQKMKQKIKQKSKKKSRKYHLSLLNPSNSIISLFCINDYCHLVVTIVTSLTTFPSTHRHKSLTPLLGRETSFMDSPKTLSPGYCGLCKRGMKICIITRYQYYVSNTTFTRTP